MIRYTVKLTETEVAELSAIINKGAHTSQAYRAAFILLNCDEGPYSHKVTNEQISRMLRVSMRTIDRVKKRFVEAGWLAVLERKASRRIYERKMDGEVEAHLVQLCCSAPPKGYARWSLRLLADKMVELKYVDSISHVAIAGVLKKTSLSLGRSGSG